jgi:Zn-finger nucleic acid-binding protein
MDHVADPERVRLCPECDEAMVKVTNGEITLDRCPRQHGRWFDGGELRAFAKANGKYQLFEQDARRRVELKDEPPRRCPGCEDRSLHAGLVQDFDIEVCDHCGGFFLPVSTSNRLYLLGAVRPDRRPTDVARGLIDLANLLDLLTLPFRC